MCVSVCVCVCVRACECVCVWMFCACSLPPDGDILWPKYVDVAAIPLLLQTPVCFSGSPLFFVSASFFSQHENIIVPNCLTFHTVCVGGVTWTRFFFYLMLAIAQNFAPPVWKLLAFECRIETSEISLRSALK